tara:strand:+ start:7 stop:192 length:186 start_codon:yes stop_codon:yes gene_type:complete
MVFDVEANEAAFIVRVIGQLPTESGAFPLHQKLVAQFKSQDVQEQEKQVANEPVVTDVTAK